LEDKVRAVAIDDETRQKVGLGENESAGVGVFDDALAVGQGLAEAAKVEIAVEGFPLVAQQAQGDLGRGAVMRGAEELAAIVGDVDRLAGSGGFCVDDVT